MKKVSVGEPMIVAQSTTEPILFGGYQDPFIRCNAEGEILVRFNSRHDTMEAWGQENSNPVYKSADGGRNWELLPDSLYNWITAQKPLPNGDYLQMCEHVLVKNLPELPELPEYRKDCVTIAGKRDVYLVDELLPILGDNIAKEFKAYRIKAGTQEIVEETCKVNWSNMPISLFDNAYLARVFIGLGNDYKVDKNGVLWVLLPGPYVTADGKLGSRRSCVHLLRSDDMGHTWEYVSTIAYKEEYNKPNSIDVEGFAEATLEFLEDGSIYCIMRSGSLHPFKIGDDNHPAPKLYCAKSCDGGRTWKNVTPFYDYGVLPAMVKLDCGTLLMSSGRPGVYIRSCDDPKAEQWNDVIPIITVPKEEVYKAYYEYSCSNTGVCVYDDHAAFLVYSDFQMTTPEGERAKSIVVRKITVE